VSERLLARRRRTLLQRYAGKLSFICKEKEKERLHSPSFLLIDSFINYTIIYEICY
jgi:hypothetical protein